jgi:hypothetical protein
MTTTRSILLQTKFLEDSETQQYIAPPNVKLVMVDNFITANRTAGNVALIIRVVPSGATPGTEHELFPSKTLAPGEVFEVPPFDLGPGDSIRTDPGAASSIVARISGRVVT